jgi:hypothetical protein
MRFNSMCVQDCFHYVFNKIIFIIWNICPIFEKLQVFVFLNMIIFPNFYLFLIFAILLKC